MAALIVTIANEKGGVGKTTTAFSLALQALAEGKRTMIVDTDHQRSSEAFRLRRRALSPDLPDIRVATAVGLSVGTQIMDFARSGEYDLIVVDSGGRDSQEMRLAMLVSHLVVIPTSSKAMETDTLNKMAKLVNEVRLQRPDLKAVLMLTRVHAGQFGAEREQLLAELEKDIDPTVPGETISKVLGVVLKAHTVYRKAFDNAYAWGRALFEMERRDPKAASEALGCYQEIMRHG